MTTILSARGVSHSFGPMVALDRIDLDVSRGEIIALVGPSGCGKSTLLELISGLASPTEGIIEVNGRSDPDDRLASCAWMPQQDCLLPWYSALDNAALGLRNRGLSRQAAREQADTLFRHLGLAGFERALPKELSGGMRQRVAFLRTLLADKEILLLDEPFAALDALTRGELQEWLLPVLGEEKRTVVLVTHDIEEALYLADRVAVITPRPGRLQEWVPGSRTDAVDRRQVVTSPDFNRRREELLELLRPISSAPGSDRSGINQPAPSRPETTATARTDRSDPTGGVS